MQFVILIEVPVMEKVQTKFLKSSFTPLLSFSSITFQVCDDWSPFSVTFSERARNGQRRMGGECEERRLIFEQTEREKEVCRKIEGERRGE